MGDRAVLVEVASLDEVLALHAALAGSRPAGVVDLVPAARTVLVRVEPRVLSLAAARAWIERTSRATDAVAPARAGLAVVELDVVYDGPDLDETADLLGLTPDALAAQHAAAEWTVAFTGFAPGFGYLVSADWPHDVPRLDSPRTRVPAGAIGLAAGFTGAYPRETPGRLAPHRRDLCTALRSGCRLPGSPGAGSAGGLPAGARPGRRVLSVGR